jgi:NADPH:quinone reductase
MEYLGVNFIDTYFRYVTRYSKQDLICSLIHFRKGLYPVPSLPSGLGKEGAGTIVALPSDPSVLNDPAYKRGNFQVGGKVATVCIRINSTLLTIQ